MPRQYINHHEEHKRHKAATVKLFYCFMYFLFFMVNKIEPKCNEIIDITMH